MTFVALLHFVMIMVKVIKTVKLIFKLIKTVRWLIGHFRSLLERLFI